MSCDTSGQVTSPLFTLMAPHGHAQRGWQKRFVSSTMCIFYLTASMPALGNMMLVFCHQIIGLVFIKEISGYFYLRGACLSARATGQLLPPLTLEHTLGLPPTQDEEPSLGSCHAICLPPSWHPKQCPVAFCLSVCLSLPPDCEKLDHEEVTTSNAYLCPSPCTVLVHSGLCWMHLISIPDLPGPEFLLDVAADPLGRLRAPAASLRATQQKCPSSSPASWQGRVAKVDLLLAYPDPAVTKHSQLTQTPEVLPPLPTTQQSHPLSPDSS